VSTPSFKVSVVGPSRVGKTTMVTAILADTERMLQGTALQVALDEETTRRVSLQQRDLRSAIEAKEFDSASLRGTEQPADYRMSLQSVGDETIEIPFHIMDYPGKWLNADLRAASQLAKDRWPECEAHIKNSVMILVPIDSAVLMEASRAQERRSVPHLLDIVNVEAAVRKWAKLRNLEEHRKEPAVIVLAPLKCEKYFNDNGGSRDDAGKLRNKVKEFYAGVLEILGQEAPDRSIRLMYVPIDTYGCVELIDAEWLVPEPGSDNTALDFVGHYRFRGNPPKLAVKAAGTVVQELCRCLVQSRAMAEVRAWTATADAHNQDLDRRLESKGFFGTIGFYFGGEALQNRANRLASKQEIAISRRRIEQLEAEVTRIAGIPNDDRAEEWAVIR
jgi:hypothetical protein